MRLERTKAYDKRNLRHAAEFDLYLSDKEAPFWPDVVTLIERKSEAQTDVFDHGGDMCIVVVCDLNYLKEFKEAYKSAKKHVQIQRRVGRGPMLVDIN